jgi:hypothetical protein
VKVRLQLPVPEASVTWQPVVSVDATNTEPVGVGPLPDTVTLTATACPTVDGSGLSDVIVTAAALLLTDITRRKPTEREAMVEKWWARYAERTAAVQFA